MSCQGAPDATMAWTSRRQRLGSRTSRGKVSVASQKPGLMLNE